MAFPGTAATMTEDQSTGIRATDSKGTRGPGGETGPGPGNRVDAGSDPGDFQPAGGPGHPPSSGQDPSQRQPGRQSGRAHHPGPVPLPAQPGGYLVPPVLPPDHRRLSKGPGRGASLSPQRSGGGPAGPAGAAAGPVCGPGSRKKAGACCRTGPTASSTRSGSGSFWGPPRAAGSGFWTSPGTSGWIAKPPGIMSRSFSAPACCGTTGGGPRRSATPWGRAFWWSGPTTWNPGSPRRWTVCPEPGGAGLRLAHHYRRRGLPGTRVAWPPGPRPLPAAHQSPGSRGSSPRGRPDGGRPDAAARAPVAPGLIRGLEKPDSLNYLKMRDSSLRSE